MSTISKTRCETVDLSISWTDDNGNLQIVEGDLIEEGGRPELIVSVDLVEDGRFVRYEVDGRYGAEFARPKDKVTVHRYIEHTEEGGHVHA